MVEIIVETFHKTSSEIFFSWREMYTVHISIKVFPVTNSNVLILNVFCSGSEDVR